VLVTNRTNPFLGLTFDSYSLGDGGEKIGVTILERTEYIDVFGKNIIDDEILRELVVCLVPQLLPKMTWMLCIRSNHLE